MFGLLFYPEDGDNTLLRNAGELSPGHPTVQPRIPYSSWSLRANPEGTKRFQKVTETGNGKKVGLSL
jgi:hypothetical protein